MMHAQRTGMTAELQAAASTLQLQWRERQQQVTETKQALEKAKADLDRVLTEKSKECGPCLSSLEGVLQTFNIKRQAYDSGAFVGNHIHRALKADVVPTLTSAPASVVSSKVSHLSQSTAAQQIVQSSRSIQQRYSTLFTQYAACRTVFSSKDILTPDAQEEFDKAVNVFLRSCRQEITSQKIGNITPKLHLLEAHVGQSMKHFGMALGLLGEQGMESIHAEFNTLDSRFSAIPSTLKRLTTCAEQHLIAALPKNISLRPPISSRKHKRPADGDE